MTEIKEQFLTARGYERSAGENSLTPSMEDYLEMIYRLSKENGYTRVNDLAECLNVQPPSVTKMVQKLHEKSLLKYEKYGMIHLTGEGEQMGKFFLDRHNVLKEFLKLLRATEDLQKDVETMEHYISVQNYQVFSALVAFFKDHPSILSAFHRYKDQLFKDADQG